MEREIREFISYLHNSKRTSYNTEVSYQRDLKKMAAFLEKKGISDFGSVRGIDLDDYLLYMGNENFASSTISRNVASIRAFFQYLYKVKRIYSDPSDTLKSPKVEKKMPEILSVAEVERLLAQPDIQTEKGQRDSAMLEVLYATGMRVSELIHLSLSDVNLRLSYIVCHDENKERVIPVGSICRDALFRYIHNARPSFVKDQEQDVLFTNYSGKPMSRQGFWKVLKGYTDEAGIRKDITPHTLRHSFAVHMLQNGADVRSVQELLGHSDISTTQVYLNMNMQKVREVYLKSHPRV